MWRRGSGSGKSKLINVSPERTSTRGPDGCVGWFVVKLPIDAQKMASQAGFCKTRRASAPRKRGVLRSDLRPHKLTPPHCPDALVAGFRKQQRAQTASHATPQSKSQRRVPQPRFTTWAGDVSSPAAPASSLNTRARALRARAARRAGGRRLLARPCAAFLAPILWTVIASSGAGGKQTGRLQPIVLCRSFLL